MKITIDKKGRFVKDGTMDEKYKIIRIWQHEIIDDNMDNIINNIKQMIRIKK